MGTVNIADGVVTLPSGRWAVAPEVNRERRGHKFYPGFEALAEIPALYATDGVKAEKKTIHLHYFTGGCDWLIAELDPSTGQAFGWARLNYPDGEWGFIDLPELEQIAIPGRIVPNGIVLPITVERDLHFTPRTFADCLTNLNL
jgi:Protein of unknown function (DUF2958)